jgi:glutamate-1-semialdehyde aminotransferase
MGNVLCRTDEIARLEQEREQGQALLRSMVVSSSDDVDWAAVIAKANELHRKEQLYLSRKNRRQRKMLDKLQKRALIKRRRHDSIGSFSVNMLTFRSTKGGAHHKSSTSVSGTSHDDHSFDHSYDNGSYGSGLSTDGFGLCRSHDEEGMEVIDEEYETVYSVPY